MVPGAECRFLFHLKFPVNHIYAGLQIHGELRDSTSGR